MKCRLLFNEEPITINRLAANVLGLNEAIVVQQIHYWLNINEKAKINIYDDKVWTYNTYDVWQKENFTFWSVRTLKSIFKKLEDKGILIKGNYNKKKYDRTLWITLNYNKLEELLLQYENDTECNHNSGENIENVEISTKCKNDTMSDSNKVQHLHNGECNIFTMDSATSAPPIPKTTKDYTKTSISTTHKDAVVEKIETPNTNKELIESTTHLIIDSSNKEYKIKKWKKDRLVKAIDIFKQQEGVYFSLLEKIYNDDKNFATYQSKNVAQQDKQVKTRFHNINQTFTKYSPDELEKILQESQKDKFK
ncbi:hypothetical protein D4A35_01765 [Paraclostridium bifermentans]|uniref:Replication protein n=1 Tax=Paraclostridium bifermentans TaxID=1490 RepID=A0A5P3X9Z9_PARBF|nr:hypothetical protein [Paraclostridium bifermentans]QEZ67719.1 hypothetical protein D4A35_01765 [Paraclostridium bifermentans]